MKKRELIERIAEEAGVPKSEAQKHFEAFEKVVTEALKAGEEVRITGFGKFSIKAKFAERLTGEVRRTPQGCTAEAPLLRVEQITLAWADGA